MKTVFKFLTAVLVMTTFGLTACSNNDDEPKNNQPVEPSTKNVFSQGLPTRFNDDFTFAINEKGQVTSIFRESRNEAIITFEYGKFTHDGKTYDVLMKERNWYTNCDMYIQTNNQGFAIHALEVEYDEDQETYTWDFEYNSDDQMISVNKLNNSEIYKITYTDGDITKVVEDDEDGSHHETTFKYTDSTHPNGIPNKGNIMFYDDIYWVDLDEMDLAYYAGLLGKSTKNLPLEQIYSNDTVKYNWVLNNNGLPIELKIIEYWNGEDRTFTYYFGWE